MPPIVNSEVGYSGNTASCAMSFIDGGASAFSGIPVRFEVLIEKYTPLWIIAVVINLSLSRQL